MTAAGLRDAIGRSEDRYGDDRVVAPGTRREPAVPVRVRRGLTSHHGLRGAGVRWGRADAGVGTGTDCSGRGRRFVARTGRSYFDSMDVGAESESSGVGSPARRRAVRPRAIGANSSNALKVASVPIIEIYHLISTANYATLTPPGTDAPFGERTIRRARVALATGARNSSARARDSSVLRGSDSIGRRPAIT